MVAVITEKPNTTTVGWIFLNENTFSIGEKGKNLDY